MNNNVLLILQYTNYTIMQVKRVFTGSLYKDPHTVYYYHINWGDNGSNDGWFSLSGIDYSSNIKDIIVNGHR